MTPAALLSHLVQRIEVAKVSSEPFHHLCLDEVFPESIYSDFYNYFPDQKQFTELRHPHAILEDGSSSRLEIVFSRNTLAKLPDEQKNFWGMIHSTLESPQLVEALKKALHPALLKRFGAELNSLKLVPRIALMQDLTGYRIGVHADIASKAITAQFYIPKDDKHEHVGTAFYSKSDSGKYEFVNRRPFKPNLGYSFTVTDDSYHGVVEPLAEEDSPRISIMIIYYIKVRLELPR